MLVGQGGAHHFVVDLVIFDDDARLRHAGGAAGFEDVDRLLAPIGLRHPAFDVQTGGAAQPVVFEQGEQLQVVEALDVLERVEFPRLGFLQPEWSARFGVEVPTNDFADLDVELFAGGVHLGGQARRDGGGGGHDETSGLKVKRAGQVIVRNRARSLRPCRLRLAPR